MIITSAALLTTAQTAERLNMSERWVRDNVPNVKLGRAVRYLPEDVDELLAKCRSKSYESKASSVTVSRSSGTSTDTGTESRSYCPPGSLRPTRTLLTAKKRQDSLRKRTESERTKA